MSTTPNLDLPQMPQNSLQPSVPYNEAMQLLDAIVVLVILDKDLTAPPTTLITDAGKRWIVGPAATGAWAGHDDDIALCTGADLWTFFTPKAQWRGWVTDEGKWYRFTGSAWADDTAAGSVPEAPVDGKAYTRKDSAWSQADAADVAYDNTASGLTSADVQAAIDEVFAAIPSDAPIQSIVAACSDETTALTVGANKVTFRNPYAATFIVTGVKASLTTAQATGALLTVDIKETGVSLLSTKITIDNTEKTSITAATPPVISDASIAADAEISVDISQIGDGTAKGLKVYLIGHL
jgi:hypothetical protein